MRNTTRKTYRFKNKFGREVDVDQEMAVSLFGNPSMKFVGEVITKLETRKLKVPKKGGSTFADRQVAVEVEVIADSYPVSNTADVEHVNGLVKLKSVINKGSSKELPRHTLDEKRKI